MAKETYLYGKRDLSIWQKRPIYMAKETYSCANHLLTLHGQCTQRSFDTNRSVYMAKKDLSIWQKRPIYMAKETYYYWAVYSKVI